MIEETTTQSVMDIFQSCLTYPLFPSQRNASNYDLLMIIPILNSVYLTIILIDY
jgi:hypothetical protein